MHTANSKATFVKTTLLPRVSYCQLSLKIIIYIRVIKLAIIGNTTRGATRSFTQSIAHDKTITNICFLLGINKICYCYSHFTAKKSFFVVYFKK